jgi:hypothetical protein
MRKRFLFSLGALLATIVLCVAVVMGQWGSPAGFWRVGSGDIYLNCPANSCSSQGQVINLPGLSAKSQLLADSAGSASTTLVNSGISFPIAARQTGTLNCELYFTSTNAAGNLQLTVNGPGTPTQVTIAGQVPTSGTTVSLLASQTATWQGLLTPGANSVTSGVQLAEFSGGIENGTSAGTLAVQFSNISASGTTTVKRGSWCSFP